MMNTTKKMVMMALFIALEIVLTRLVAIMPSTFSRISLSFLVYAIAGRMYGVVYTSILAGIGDIVGMLLFPSGTYIVGFTLSAMITGAVFGYLKYAKNLTLTLVMQCVVLALFVEAILNTTWLVLLYDSSFGPLLVKRIPGIITNFMIRLVVLIPLFYKVEKQELFKA